MIDDKPQYAKESKYAQFSNECPDDVSWNIPDNKLRVWFGGRISKPAFAAMKSAGFAYWRGQKLFAAVWSPAKEDFLESDFGFDPASIEHTCEEDDADSRSYRFETYSDNAAARSKAAYERSNAAVAGIPLGQPIMVGHHSEKRHRAALARSWSAMDKSVEESKKADYWKQRAQASVSHADRRLRPEAIKRRIELLEKELRTAARQMDPKNFEGRAGRRVDWEDEDTIELWNRNIDRWTRIQTHAEIRLAYEQAMYEASGGLVSDKKPLQVGGAIQNRFGHWLPILKVNRKSVTTIYPYGGWRETQSFDRIFDAASPEEVKAGKVKSHFDRDVIFQNLREVGKDPFVIYSLTADEKAKIADQESAS